nr:protein kinase [Angustibacter aerolatus]
MTGDDARLGPYRLRGLLGEGGMGVVHLGLDQRGRAVAIKVLRAHIAHDPDARARLAREVVTLRRVRHPLVAEVLDADVDGEQPYVVTRFVPGPGLDAVVREGGPLRPDQARAPRARADRCADRDPRRGGRAPRPQARQRAAARRRPGGHRLRDRARRRRRPAHVGRPGDGHARVPLAGAWSTATTWAPPPTGGAGPRRSPTPPAAGRRSAADRWTSCSTACGAVTAT